MGYQVSVGNPQIAGRPIAIDGAIHYPLFDFTLLEGFLDEVRPDVMVAYGSNWAAPYNQLAGICAQRDIKLLWYVAVEYRDISLAYLQSLVGATRVATMSRYGQEVLRRHHITAHYVPHGCDFSIYKPMNPKPRFDVAGDKFIFGQVARNSLRKEWPILLAAFSQLPHRVKQQAVVYAHTLPLEEAGGKPGWNFPEMILTMGLQGKVLMPSTKASKYYGYSEEEMAVTYNVLHCHLALSSGEGFCKPMSPRTGWIIPS